MNEPFLVKGAQPGFSTAHDHQSLASLETQVEALLQERVRLHRAINTLAARSAALSQASVGWDYRQLDPIEAEPLIESSELGTAVLNKSREVEGAVQRLDSLRREYLALEADFSEQKAAKTEAIEKTRRLLHERQGELAHRMKLVALRRQRFILWCLGIAAVLFLLYLLVRSFR